MTEMPLSEPPVGTPAPSAPRTMFARPFELGVVAAIVVLDQITKALVRANLPIGDSRTIIPGFLDLAHVQNTGAAFGMLNNVDFAYKPVVMVIIAGIALLAIAAYGTQLGFNDRLARMGLVLILGGAAGNLIDRAIEGSVVDFVDAYWGDFHFWAFNVADAAISVGAVLVILDTLGLGRRHASHPV
ncbi:MAG TPA: signal peptidase II [Vicinamibacterales bacterium]|nr:signal peptidase II [Vicinamibacterales bacterium]